MAEADRRPDRGSTRAGRLIRSATQRTRRPRASRPGRRALVCATHVPEHDRQSGDRRLADLVALLSARGFAVTLAARGAGEERYLADLRRRGVVVHADVGDSIAEVIYDQDFELALLPFWHLAEAWTPALREASPAMRVIVDSVDVHFLREARAAFAAESVPDGRGPLGRNYGSRLVRELNAYAGADLVLTVSTKEACLLNDLTGRPGLAAVVPDFADLPPSPLAFGDREGLLFVGNFRHKPNVAALEVLCHEILPRLTGSLLEQHPVRVVGNALDETLAAPYTQIDHLQLDGWVPSVEPHLAKARVCLAPVPFGAGTKRKVVEALTVGTPTVTTSVGAEGLPLTHGTDVLIADEPEDFARAVERLASDEPLWSRLRDNGLRRMAEHHSREVASERLGQALETALARPRTTMRSSAPDGAGASAGPGRALDSTTPRGSA